MHKRLLFVDDEPMVLDGLRRALWSMRNEWEMEFVSDGAAALEALDREPFDAIISDMRMPNMDGAQLLEAVKERHGDVVRIVLSGQSSKEAVLRSVAPAHQFLSKPCDLNELKNRLNQAFTSRDLLRNQPLASIVSRMRSIPSLPTLYNDLTAALRSENTSLGQIEQIISKDVGMAAKILQLANSAFIAAHGRVSSLHEALSLIGAETVRSLTLSIHVFSQFDRNGVTAVYFPAIWEHSVSAASLAHRIAMSETRSKAAAEESFTTGLIHDVGKIVLLAELPNEYRRVIQGLNGASRNFYELEMKYIGCSHEQIGAYLMSVWGLPQSIVQAVEHHHHPSEIGNEKFTPLSAVHCADVIASSGDSALVNRDVELDTRHAEALGLAAKMPEWTGFYEDHQRAVAEHGLNEKGKPAAENVSRAG
jgi:HD-like signal output (HDOD) protein/CheY-like chemotaxis protein